MVARRFKVPCDLRSVRTLCEAVRGVLVEAGFVASEVDAWELALAEGANNAVKYCQPEARTNPVLADLWILPDWVEVRLTDHTAGFDWPDRVELPPDDSESGRGIFLIQSLTDESYYLRGQVNCLVLRRRNPLAAFPELADPGAALREARHTLDLMTEELASSYESLSAIFGFSSELHSAGNSTEFIHRWLHQLLTIMESDWFLLRLAGEAPSELRVAITSAKEWSGKPIPLGVETGGELSIECRAAIFRRDMWFDAASPLRPGDPLEGLAGKGCGFAHPIFSNDTLVGVLSIGRTQDQRPFESGQVNVAQTFGDFLGLQLLSKQMQEEQVQARLNARDLEIAARMQRSLLPEALPGIAGSSLAGFYRSAREIGGDYYDAISIDEDHVLLVVADVMGKGLPAALFAFMFRSLVRARLDLASRPGELLRWLNQNLFKELDRSELFITAQLASYNHRQRTFRVANAGHPSLLVAGPAGGVRELTTGGPPLGIISGYEYLEESMGCGDGCALMYTDGLVEARNVAGELMGAEAVKWTLSEAGRLGHGADEIRRTLVTLLQTFEGDAAPADDTAFIVIAGNESRTHG